MDMKVHMLGETRREQWHAIVNIMRQTHQCLKHEAFCELCDELDRYIDAVEDVLEEDEEDEDGDL